LSENRRRVNWRIVGWGIGLQFVVALAILKTPLRTAMFDWTRVAIDTLTQSTLQGASFVFGKLPTDMGIGAVVGFQVLPVIIMVSAISSVLYHLRVIPVIVHGIAWLMQRSMKTSGAETFSCALQIFFGIEGVPALRGYLRNMTRSELLTVMVSFMGTTAGSVLVVYASPLVGAEPGHLLAASLMSAPAAIVFAKLLVPETEKPETSGDALVSVPIETHNVIDAAGRGTSDGVMLAINVGAMLIVFIGLVHLVDQLFMASAGKWIFAMTHSSAAGAYTITDAIGWLFQPVALILGVPMKDMAAVGALLGKKTVLNEFLAYIDLKTLKETISPRSFTLATYALCGFANPGSLGILLAGMTGMVPERRADVTALSIKAFVGGALASFMTACVAGVLIDA
jgi:CNT family concentrative nucleoside transporter